MQSLRWIPIRNENSELLASFRIGSNTNLIADITIVILVMSHEFTGLLQKLRIQRMLRQALDGNNYRFLHFVTYNLPHGGLHFAGDRPSLFCNWSTSPSKLLDTKSNSFVRISLTRKADVAQTSDRTSPNPRSSLPTPPWHLTGFADSLSPKIR